MAFYRLEPWGTEEEDWRAGMIASTIVNVNRDPKKQKKPFQPRDFMPKRDPKPPQDPDEQANILGQWGRVWEKKFDEGDS